MYFFLNFDIFFPNFFHFFYTSINFFVKYGRTNAFWVVYCVIFNFFSKNIRNFTNFEDFLGNLIKNLIVFLRLFLVSITFFLIFSLFIYDLVIFFIQEGRMIMVLGVFLTFYWIWKKSDKNYTIFEFFSIFLWIFWQFLIFLDFFF